MPNTIRFMGEGPAEYVRGPDNCRGSLHEKSAPKRLPGRSLVLGTYPLVTISTSYTLHLLVRRQFGLRLR